MIADFSVVQLDSEVARLAAYLRRTYNVKTPDSAIAATALRTGTTLLTRNIKDFQKIDELSVMKI